MGQRGPAKTPLKILQDRGSGRARRREAEPKAKGKPRRPSWLNAKAARVWRRIIPRLEEMGILGTIDSEALARYSVIFAKWRDAEEWLEKNGTMFPVRGIVTEAFPEGVVVGFKEYPQVGRAIAYAEQLLRLEKQFGMNPGARANLVTETEDPDENRGGGKDRFFTPA